MISTFFHYNFFFVLFSVQIELNAWVVDTANLFENQTFTAPSVLKPDFANQITDITDESDTTILRINNEEGSEDIERSMIETLS